jgi:hypothetical protein
VRLCGKTLPVPAAKPKRELDFSGFPAASITEYTTLVCLACIFEIFTKHLGLAARSAFSEIKKHTPTIDELTGRGAMRPYFDTDEKRPHCPYCGSTQRWLARFETYCIEGGRQTDVARRTLIKKLPKAADQFVILEKKSDSRAVFFEWLDTVGRYVDFQGDQWLLDTTRMYLERREPKTAWQEIFEDLGAVRRSSRLTEGWEVDGGRLFLTPQMYSEAILIQYLISRSHAHGGMTLEGRLTLSELIRRLRYSGYLEFAGITEWEVGEVFEKLIDHLAAKHEWYKSVGGDKAYRTARGSERVSTKKARGKSNKQTKSKSKLPDADEFATEPVKLHYIVDRRDFLEKVKSVYASYA